MPSHTVKNLTLEPEVWQKHQLETRFEMSKRAYNMVLDEWLRRRRKYIQSEEFRQAEQLEDDEARREAFTKGMKAHGFHWPAGAGNSAGKSDGEKVRASVKNDLFDNAPDITYHLGAPMLRRVAAMAVNAVKRFHSQAEEWKGFQKPKPTHKPKPLVACSNQLRFVEDHCSRGDCHIIKISGVRGGADALHIHVDEDYLDQPKIQRSLANRSDNAKVKICKETFGYQAHITCKGRAPLSEDTVVKDGIVGVDIGPSMVAAVGDDEAWFGPITDKTFIKDHKQELRRIGRKLSRQTVANNPHMFNEDGEKIREGERVVRDRQRATYDRNRETYRVMLAERKRQHFELIKHLLSLGNKFIVEDNEYRGWQASLFGAQIGDFAPATFINRLERKAEAAGGWLKKISTYDTYLSSRCQCGHEFNKDLTDRVHDCDQCGIRLQRDMYSAFLARHVDVDEDRLREGHAQREWPELESALRSALSDNKMRDWT